MKRMGPVLVTWAALSVLLAGCRSESARSAGDDAAQTAAARASALAVDRVRSAAQGDLNVTSTAFGPGQSIPQMFSAYGEGVSPPLSWSGAPEETGSFAVIVEDPDAPMSQPYAHWLIYNLPAGRTSLPQRVATEPVLETLGGARQGRNTHGSVGYFGPKPPAGDPPHRYHFQVFALDEMLDLPAGADRAALLEAVRGHVLAAGELIGTYRRQP